jgi:hypothetical protein
MQPIKGTHDETQSARSRVLDITVENDVAGEEAKVIEFSEQILDAVFIDARLAHLIGIGGGGAEYDEAVSVQDELR